MTRAREHFATLKGVVPQEQFYKYHDFWKTITQSLVAKMSLLHFLSHYTLLDKEEASNLLGGKICILILEVYLFWKYD